MRTTHTQTALQSLTLQRENHLKQELIISQKQRHSQLAQKKQVQKKTRPSSYPSDQTDGGSALNHDMTSAFAAMTTARATMRPDMETVDEAGLIYRTMDECDSLLQLLNHRASEMKSPAKPTNPQTDTTRENTSQAKLTGSNGIKIPKDDKVVIQELRVHNGALQNHIVELLKECEYQQRQLAHYRRENDELKERLNQIQKPFMEESTDSEKYYPIPVGMNVHDLPSLELPPLEMPEFDFSTLKIESDETQ